MAAPTASSVPSVPPSEEPNSFLFSLLTDMLNPGVRSQSVIFVNVVLGALLFVIFALVLLGHYNIHLLVLSVLTIIVLALFNWFLSELRSSQSSSKGIRKKKTKKT